MNAEPKPEDRKIIVMKWGDHCWLRDLSGAPELNGRHVRLDKWIDAKQRWQCTPIGWTYTEKFIGVKPKNLSSEPPQTESEAIAAPLSSTGGPQLAASLEILMKRGDELRRESLCLSNTNGASDSCLEASLRLGMCEADLLEVQLEILNLGGAREQVEQANAKLNEVQKQVNMQLELWTSAGLGMAPDYWEAPTLADEATIKADIEKYREALSSRR